MIRTPKPDLVVDLGCGTGLSTLAWAERAKHVIGIEPSHDMRLQATRKLDTHPYASRVAFQAGVAHQTGLPDGSADIVTCAQSFHWMEPSATLAEIARILRPGGIFATYDYSWPPTISRELEQVFQEIDERFDRLIQVRADGQPGPLWPKEQQLERMRESGHFRFTREMVLHNREQGDAYTFHWINNEQWLQLPAQARHRDRTRARAGSTQAGRASLYWLRTDPMVFRLSH